MHSRGPSTSSIICCIPGYFKRTLDQKWGSWDPNGNRELRASQTAARPTALQHAPTCLCFLEPVAICILLYKAVGLSRLAAFFSASEGTGQLLGERSTSTHIGTHARKKLLVLAQAVLLAHLSCSGELCPDKLHKFKWKPAGKDSGWPLHVCNEEQQELSGLPEGTRLALSREGVSLTSHLPRSPGSLLWTHILLFCISLGSGLFLLPIFFFFFEGAYNRKSRGRDRSASLWRLLMLCLLQAAWHARAVGKGRLTQPPGTAEAAWDGNNLAHLVSFVPLNLCSG